MRKLQTYSALIVDDDKSSLEEMYEYLDILFLKVYRATDAMSALKLLKENRIDIVFTDIKMPTTDGFELISQIKALNEKTLVVIISAYDDKEKLLKAIKLEILDYIIKPLNSKKLQHALELCTKKLKQKDKYICLDGDICWDSKNYMLFRTKDPISLTPSETKLFGLLIENINKPIKSEDIFYYLWGETEKVYNSKNVRNIIFGLRKKLKPFDIIKNIYGGRYMIVSKVQK